jgi:hypothetical protein
MMAYPNASPYRVALGRAAKVVLIKSNGVCDAEQSLREIIEQDVSTFFIERGLTNKVLILGLKVLKTVSCRTTLSSGGLKLFPGAIN